MEYTVTEDAAKFDGDLAGGFAAAAGRPMLVLQDNVGTIADEDENTIADLKELFRGLIAKNANLTRHAVSARRQRASAEGSRDAHHLNSKDCEREIPVAAGEAEASRALHFV